MRKVFGIGETILDIIFRNDQPQKAVPGGSVFNGLISLGRLNVPVSFISELGNDRVGDMIRDFMEDNHITTEFVDRFPDGKSPISLAFLDDDKNANYIFYKDYPAQRLEVPLPKIEKDDIFVFGSYYSLNPVLRTRMVEFLQYAQERKAIIYYDPNFRSSHKDEAIKLTSTIIENLEYADIVRGSIEDFFYMYNQKEVDKVYKDKIRFYCSNFLCTAGAKEISLRTKSITKEYAIPPLEAVSTIGAGDNFNAGIIYGLLKYNVRHCDLGQIDEATWDKIIRCGIEFSADVCRSFNNSISPEFARQLPPIN